MRKPNKNLIQSIPAVSLDFEERIVWRDSHENFMLVDEYTGAEVLAGPSGHVWHIVENRGVSKNPNHACGHVCIRASFATREEARAAWEEVKAGTFEIEVFTEDEITFCPFREEAEESFTEDEVTFLRPATCEVKTACEKIESLLASMVCKPAVLTPAEAAYFAKLQKA